MTQTTTQRAAVKLAQAQVAAEKAKRAYDRAYAAELSTIPVKYEGHAGNRNHFSVKTGYGDGIPANQTRLIYAAPALLSALEEARDAIYNYQTEQGDWRGFLDNAYDTACAAIEAATNQS